MSNPGITEKEENEEKSSRKQKNLRIGEEYDDELKNLAEEWYGSTQKQGHVVEDLIDMVSGNTDIPMMQMIEEMHSQLVGGGTPSDVTHTRSSQTSDEDDEEESLLDELESLAQNDEPINPDEYDLTVIKGADVDRAGIARASLLHDYSSEPITKSDIRNHIRQKVGYSYSGANELAEEVLFDLHQVPELSDEIDELASKSANDPINIRKSPFTERQLRGIDDPEAFLEGMVNLNCEKYTLTEDAYLTAVQEDYDELVNLVNMSFEKNKDNRVARIDAVSDIYQTKLDSRTQDEVEMAYKLISNRADEV